MTDGPNTPMRLASGATRNEELYRQALEVMRSRESYWRPRVQAQIQMFEQVRELRRAAQGAIDGHPNGSDAERKAYRGLAAAEKRAVLALHEALVNLGFDNLYVISAAEEILGDTIRHE